MRRQLALGVLGHVDHGKTSLVRALTGTDTDRLPEEKARGMSIVPGYAWLARPAGCIDLIDVPGHEDYVRSMVCGAAGIEAALLVVDAREGVRPQTREHVAIAGLLGVRAGLVALTKSDLAGDRIGREREVKRFLYGTCLENAPLIATSARTGEGIPGLLQGFDRLLAAAGPLEKQDGFHLPVDRVFTLPGHGTVVTGTLRRGLLRRGDEIEIAPRGARAGVRQLQVHGRAVDCALPGQRVGVNLRGVRRDAVARGDALASPGLIRPSALLHARASFVQDMRIGSPRMLRLHIGTASVMARVRRVSETEVRVRCAHPVCSLAGDQFILRDEGGRSTVGGGTVVDLPVRKPGKQPIETRIAAPDPLQALPEADRAAAAVIERAFLAGGAQPPDLSEVVGEDSRKADLCRLLLARGRLLRAGPVVFHRDAVAEVRARLRAAYPPPAQFTVSQVRQLVGSTRKFTVPLLELFDGSRLTRRAGDLRSLR